MISFTENSLMPILYFLLTIFFQWVFPQFLVSHWFAVVLIQGILTSVWVNVLNYQLSVKSFFFAGFFAGFLLWILYSFYGKMGAGSDLYHRVSQMLHLGNSYLLILFQSLIGGLLIGATAYITALWSYRLRKNQ
ncbi:MAG: hypothetical protein MUE53_01500 [Chitinophagales bacterium]|jgi:hypothetical protein|nr:hypothetical protein [Chitinophagales bacterium]